MSEEQAEKITILMTHGPENPDLCTIPLVMATAAQAMDVDCKVILQSEAVMLALKGIAERVEAPGLKPLRELVSTYRQEGGKFYVCTPCCKARNIAPKELIKGAEMCAAGLVIDEVASSTNVMCY